MVNVVIIIAQNNFHDKEFMDTKNALQSKGFKCDIASKTIDKAVGKFGLEIMPDLTIQDAILSLDMYKAVVFIGGSGAREYFEDKDALGLAKLAAKKEMLVGAICIAPMILAHAGILERKDATVFDGDLKQSEYFKNNSIIYKKEPVVADKNIITADGPESAKAFGDKIAELLEE